MTIMQDIWLRTLFILAATLAAASTRCHAQTIETDLRPVINAQHDSFGVLVDGHRDTLGLFTEFDVNLAATGSTVTVYTVTVTDIPIMKVVSHSLEQYTSFWRVAQAGQLNSPKASVPFGDYLLGVFDPLALTAYFDTVQDIFAYLPNSPDPGPLLSRIDYPFSSEGDFFLAFELIDGEVISDPPVHILGWVKLNLAPFDAGGGQQRLGLTYLDGAYTDDPRGIVVGTYQIVPEPGASCLAVSGAAIVWRRFRRRR